MRIPGSTSTLPVIYRKCGHAKQAELGTLKIESIFLSRVEGRGFHVEGEGTMSRVEGNILSNFFLEKLIIDAINVMKTNKKNLKSKWRVNIFWLLGGRLE